MLINNQILTALFHFKPVGNFLPTMRKGETLANQSCKDFQQFINPLLNALPWKSLVLLGSSGLSRNAELHHRDTFHEA